VAATFVWPQYLAVVSVSLWLLTFLVSFFIKRPNLNLFKKNLLQPLPLLYLLYVTGMLYTTNMQAGYADLGLKTSLLVFPLIVAQLGFKDEYLRIALTWFVISCFASMAGCLGLAILHYTQTGDGSFFFYIKLSAYIHAGYYAMMLCFATAAIFEFYCLKLLKPTIAIVLGLVLTVFIIMLSTKTGLIGALLVYAYIGLRLGLQYKQVVKGVTITLTGFALVVGCSYLLPNIKGRISEAATAVNDGGENKATESTAARIAVWKDAVTVIKQHWLTGAGTGDGKDLLKEQFLKSGNDFAYRLNYNAHNQYLQTTLGLGIGSLLLLIASVLTLLYYGFMVKNYTMVVFGLLIGLNYLTEAMLERQAGVLYIAFFTTLFAASYISKKRNKGVKTTY
jgi:O-antigen ligase